MGMLKRLNARLAGARLYLVAILFALPDVLTALVGFDWATVLPPSYEGYGAKIGAALGLVRLVIIPMLKSVREANRRAADPPADGGPR